MQQEQQVQVPMNMIINMLHERYSKVLGPLMQENAEQAAGIEVMGNELNELRAKNAMLAEQLEMAHRPPVQQDQPGGVGLLSASGQVGSMVDRLS